MVLTDLFAFVWNHPLNAANRPAAIGRLIRWQIASRILPAPVALPFVEDTRLLTTRGMAGATGNWYSGLHEAADMAFVLHLLRPGDTFADVGANIGSYTILAAGGVGAKVTSIEPIPATFAHLERNIALNGLGERVRAVQCGLSDAPGTARFTTHLDNMNHIVSEATSGSLGEATSGSLEVPLRTLDDLMGADVPALIKVDVEGHEPSVLKGATRTLADPRLLAAVIEASEERGSNDAQVADIMRASGFEETGYDPFARALIAPARAARNMIFIRDRDAVARRVTGARRYRLVNGEI